MSLLTNPFFNVGMGLLANSGPSLTPVNPYRGIAEGLFNAQQGRVAEQEAAYRQWQMEQQRREMEAQQERQAMMRQWASSQPDPIAASLFPEEAYRASLAGPADSVELSTAGALGLQGYPPETPVEVKISGGRVVDYTPMNPPQAGAAPTDIQLYQMAQEQGYKGSLMDFIKEKGAAGATKIEMGANDRASPSDVASMVYPDGSSPLPGTPWPEIIAKGGRVMTPEEKARAQAEGAQGAKDDAAAEKGNALFGDYVAAAKTYQSGVLPYGSADEQAKRARSALVTWYAKNVLGTPGAEPSPSLYDKAEKEIPDFGGPVDSALFNARMTAIQRSINSALNKEEKKGGMEGATLVYDPKLKRLVPAE